VPRGQAVTLADVSLPNNQAVQIRQEMVSTCKSAVN